MYPRLVIMSLLSTADIWIRLGTQIDSDSDADWYWNCSPGCQRAWTAKTRPLVTTWFPCWPVNHHWWALMVY